ncbi:sensor histidine kinase [Streptomyces sp. NBC_00019]|uniref:sensor histidine kinase n=1 Tax=Streptomyces sp. NBC_00019 TaxID=2975623 RepID=UPI00324DF972
MSTPWQRYADDHARTVDTMTAALLFACFLFGSEINFPQVKQLPDSVGPTIALATAACGSLFWQRTRPRAVVVVTAVCTAAASALGMLLTPLLMAPLMLALYRLAVHTGRRAARFAFLVAHHLALANAQAGTAAHLSRTHPDQVHRILTELAGTTSAALRETKATVGLLRQRDDPDAPLAPSPGIARLDELTASFEAVGLPVRVDIEGTPRPLSPGVDLTAYRIVQEALTNVTKHAAARTAYVRLGYATDHLTITVTDDGTSTAAAEPGQGFGLIGMRERARSMGGALRAGHRVEGGFEVTTRLPLYPIAPDPEERNP